MGSRKNKLLIFFIGISLISCQLKTKEERITNINSDRDTSHFEFVDVFLPADSSVYFYPNAILSDNPAVRVEKGSKTVFSYKYNSEKQVNCADCGLFEEILFEVDLQKAEKFETSDLASVKFFYDRKCFCEMPDSLENLKNTGTLKLTRSSDTSYAAVIIFQNIIDENESQFDTIHTTFTKFKAFCENEDHTNCYDSYDRKTGIWKEIYSTSIREGIYHENLFTGTLLYHRVNVPEDTSVFITYKNGALISEIHPVK